MNDTPEAQSVNTKRDNLLSIRLTKVNNGYMIATNVGKYVFDNWNGVTVFLDKWNKDIAV